MFLHARAKIRARLREAQAVLARAALAPVAAVTVDLERVAKDAADNVARLRAELNAADIEARKALADADAAYFAAQARAASAAHAELDAAKAAT